MTLLNTITTGQRALPPRVLIYGTDKVGKNTWAAGAPKPITIQAEEGSDEIGTARFPLATSFDDIMAQVAALASEDHDYETVILDSADWIERLVWSKVCADAGKKSIEEVGGGYGKGFTIALTLWRDLLDGLKYLRNEKSMAVIIICHHEVKTVSLPECDPFERYQPKLQKAAMGMLKEWCDAILFAGYRVFTKSVEGKGDTVIVKGVGTGERILQCSERPTHLAGNRYNLPDSLALPKHGGFALFAGHVANFYASKSTAPVAAVAAV
ncbi:MAG: ATP-binding protein [Burkholderiaceae bacterium]|nr:ATP-binding protein [Burkholderiaceae bacterium]